MSFLRIVAAVLLLAVGFSTAVRAESTLVPKLPLPELVPLYTKALHFTNEVRLRVESPKAQYQVGNQVLLFDVNSECFVGIRRNEMRGVNELIAFPRLDDSGEGSAWITNEKELIFGSPTHSVEGVLLIRKGEILPVVGQASQTFTVLFQRFGREANITLPRTIGSCLVEPATPPTALIMAHEAADAAAQAEAAQTAVEIVKPVPQPTRPILPASIARVNREPTRPTPYLPPASLPSAVSNGRPNAMLALSVNEMPSGAVVRMTTPPLPLLVASPPVAPAPIPAPQPGPTLTVQPSPTLAVSPPASPPPAPAPTSAPVVAAQASAPTNPAPAVAMAAQRTDPPVPATNFIAAALATNAALTVARTVPSTNIAAVVMAKAAPPAAPAPSSSTFLTFLSFNSLTFWVLVATVAIEGVMIARLLLRKKAGLPTLDAGNQVFSFESVGESVMDAASESFVTGSNGDLQGELDKFSMGHVVQFFHSSGESGTLTISGGNGRIDKIIFDRGHIIDAMSGNRCGESAAEIILRRRQGSFKFTREDNSKRLRLITQDTMGLLMEAARVIDEKGWAD